MSRGPDAHTLLLRALIAGSAQRGCTVQASESDWVRWASATFTGARHLVTLTARTSPALDAWVSALPDQEFALRGHLVADLVVTGVRHEDGVAAVRLEVLTLEDR